MEKIIPSNATRISLNDRFTMLSGTKGKPQNNIKRRQTRSRSRSRSRSRTGGNGSGTMKNRKLVEDLERKLKLKLATRLKQRSIRGVGQNRRGQPAVGVRRLNRGARPIRGGRTNSVGNLTLVSLKKVPEFELHF